MSLVKQNLHPNNEANINKLINLKLTASYVYLSLGMYFDRDDVALPNFSKFFLERSLKERDQTEHLLEYQNTRGGRILLQTVAKPSRDDWKGGLDAIKFSLDHQKSLNRSLLEFHKAAGENSDPHLCDFLESSFFTDSHDTIKTLGDYASNLSHLITSDPHGKMGEYLFDKHTL
ncbi:ferritin, lower subunit-like [Cyprinus carpio]|uniref:Ferritin n=2 Tax=Cyprinus carpio TaxID=7962 RepID=A0A8C1RTD5_CYPCA|nr:ferritin, lower subunit-like [Cyprinus carpio]XP_018923326.1 ferritin, lower subunit-like [Cyprinus carpio]